MLLDVYLFFWNTIFLDIFLVIIIIVVIIILFVYLLFGHCIWVLFMRLTYFE